MIKLKLHFGNSEQTTASRNCLNQITSILSYHKDALI